MAEFASNAKGNTALALGGTSLGVSLLAPHLAGLFGGMGYNGYGNGSGYVSKEAFDLQKKISEQESTISLLKSESNTEVKIADVYSRLKGDILEQERINNARQTEQLVWNAKMDSRMAVAENQIGQLMGMTGLYVEASRVTPMPMDRYNSWTAPTA